MKNTIELQVEEIESETNPIKKNQLLQKYGLVEPKLTKEEQHLIADTLWLEGSIG